MLIVEFAKQRQDHDGVDAQEAAVHAAHVRLRPILMTSLAFIAGVGPLVVAHGAGAEMRQSLGTTVFSGMLGVTAVTRRKHEPYSSASGNALIPIGFVTICRHEPSAQIP
nr:efflux RND transporter permease subunit [Silvibacterium bohemicum]